MNNTHYDICVIGAGRVGLPLALTLSKNNFKVAVLDKNEKVIHDLKNKEMPFLETGCDELLEEVKLGCFTTKTKNYPNANTYILTVGTPLLDHIEIDDSQIKNALNFLVSKIDIKDKNIILRSTISPNTSLRIEKYLESISNYKSNVDFFLTFCPERIAEGVAVKELYELPQIIGCNSKTAYDRIVNIFESYNVITYKASFIEAELSKLFCNIYRYINFSIPNYFMYLSEFYNSDVFRIFNMMNTNYPRNNGLKGPGFAGATCLRKDWGQINESFPQTDIILQAYKINEFMPKFYIDSLLKHTKIHNKKVAILGYTAKKDTDDTRDTLTSKLIRYVNKEIPKQLYISDPNLPSTDFYDKFNDFSFFNHNIDYSCSSADIIIIAMNHSKYYEYFEKNKHKLKNKIIVDGWGILNKKLINKL